MLCRDRASRLLAVPLIALAATAIAACGSSKKSTSASTPKTVALTISGSGSSAHFTVPSSVTGGTVNLTLKNSGKEPHSAQLGLIEGNHTANEALQIIGGNSNKTPDWLRAEGGVSVTAPGQTGTATVTLPAGKYVLVDIGGGGPGSSGPPAHTTLNVTQGPSSSLPTTGTTVTAAAPSKDHYKWEINGPLTAGTNKLTFDSKGTNTLHFIGAFRLNGNASQAQIINALNSNGKPPGFVDTSTFTNTAALDGGKSQVTSLVLPKPGKYVFFCALHDRDGGKIHYQEGLLTTVTVK